MTLAEIELDVFRRLDYADAAPAVGQGACGRLHQPAPRADRRLATGCARCGSAQVALTTVADQFSYGLPFGCARVIRVVDLANQYQLAHSHAGVVPTAVARPDSR